MLKFIDNGRGFDTARAASGNGLRISEREQEVLKLLCEGENYKTIAEALFVSSNTVKAHIKNIYEKVKLAGERVVTMDLGFNFDNDVSIYDPVTRTAAIVSEVPYNGGGGSRNAILMADGRVLTFGFGDITTPGDTKLVEVYDATANEWEAGTYSGVGPVGFPLLHLLPDSSVFAISTNPENIGQDIKNRCWIINRDDMTPATEVRTEQFRLSPNPASDWLIVDGLKGENIDLSLFHPDGKMAARWENVAGRVDLKSRHLAPGLYFFNIEKMEGGIWQSGKIILQ